MSNTSLNLHKVVSVDLGVANKCDAQLASPTYYTQHIIIRTADGSTHDIALFWEDGLCPNLTLEPQA